MLCCVQRWMRNTLALMAAIASCRRSADVHLRFVGGSPARWHYVVFCMLWCLQVLRYVQHRMRNTRLWWPLLAAGETPRFVGGSPDVRRKVARLPVSLDIVFCMLWCPHHSMLCSTLDAKHHSTSNGGHCYSCRGRLPEKRGGSPDVRLRFVEGLAVSLQHYVVLCMLWSLRHFMLCSTLDARHHSTNSGHC